MPFIDYTPFTQEEKCTSEGHNPPRHQYLKPGMHTWQCVACGKITKITVY